MHCNSENFILSEDKKQIVWYDHGIKKDRKFILPLKSVIELKDETGFVIVASPDEFGMHNAMIINKDGSLRFQLFNPFNNKEEYPYFWEIYYVYQDLNCVISGDNGVWYDYACTLNDKTGKLYDFHPTK